jgi:amidase
MKPLAFCFVSVLLYPVSGLYAETHHYTPTTYANSFSGSQPPVLHLKSGDRIVTTTVDDSGVGPDGKHVAEGPNPQTGPFFIDGAEPGDLIVVTLDKLEPARASGTAPSTMASNAFDAGGLANKAGKDPLVPWTIDKAKGVVRLDLAKVIPNVDWRERYTSSVYELPLRPTLGSLGVAPATTDSSSSTAHSNFGGDLECADLTEGARVMFPVFQPGALIFLGHGHARQGDGVVGGGGIEVSMNVELSVELVKKREWPHSSVMRPSTVAGEFEIVWPRVETSDYVMTIASAPTLLEALQHATTELHHWLDDDFGFSEKSLSIFLAQAIEIEVANIGYTGAAGATPQTTVVAKVRRSYLPKEAASAAR